MASPWARAVRLPASLRPTVFALLAVLALFGTRTAGAVEERVWFSAGPSIVFYDPKVALKDDLGISVSGTGYLGRQGVFVLIGVDLPTELLLSSGIRVQTHHGTTPVAAPD